MCVCEKDILFVLYRNKVNTKLNLGVYLFLYKKNRGLLKKKILSLQYLFGINSYFLLGIWIKSDLLT